MSERVSVYGLLAEALCRAAVNFAVAIICMVLVMRAIVPTAVIRRLISRVRAMGLIV